jgi:hypothetical protein
MRTRRAFTPSFNPTSNHDVQCLLQTLFFNCFNNSKGARLVGRQRRQHVHMAGRAATPSFNPISNPLFNPFELILLQSFQ